jgi:hypothetical protein
MYYFLLGYCYSAGHWRHFGNRSRISLPRCRSESSHGRPKTLIEEGAKAEFTAAWAKSLQGFKSLTELSRRPSSALKPPLAPTALSRPSVVPVFYGMIGFVLNTSEIPPQPGGDVLT